MGTETFDVYLRRKGYENTAAGINSLPETLERDVPLEDIATVNVEALLGRISSGIAVQLLWEPATDSTFVTVCWGERSQTFEVDPADAYEAFHHPFVYGCTLREERHVFAYEPSSELDETSEGAGV